MMTSLDCDFKGGGLSGNWDGTVTLGLSSNLMSTFASAMVGVVPEATRLTTGGAAARVQMRQFE